MRCEGGNDEESTYLVTKSTYEEHTKTKVKIEFVFK